MSRHTLDMARLLGWMLVFVGIAFGALLFRDGHIDHPTAEMAVALGPLVLGALLIAGKRIVPLVTTLWATYKGKA